MNRVTDKLRSGYYKFTRPIAYQTPCFSSLADKVTPPPITAGLAANPTDSSLPTSAVLNVAWAMGFNTTGETSPPGLSTGATVGIGVGAGVVAIALLVVVGVFLVRRRKNKSGTPPGAADKQLQPDQGMTYQPGYHAPGGPASPPPVGGSDWKPPGVSQEYRGGGYSDGYQPQQGMGGHGQYRS